MLFVTHWSPIAIKSMRPSTQFSSLVALLGVINLSGCFDSGPATIPVYGKVTFVGRDRPYGVQVSFRPSQSTGPLRPIISVCKPDGSYEAKSFERSKGLMPGTYVLTVQYNDLIAGKDPKLESSFTNGQFDAGELVVDPESGAIEHNIEVPAQAAAAKKS